jgi:hypothetical protein
MHDTKTLTLLFINEEIFSKGLLPGGIVWDGFQWERLQ